MRELRLRWFEHISRRASDALVRMYDRISSRYAREGRGRGRPKKNRKRPSQRLFGSSPRTLPLIGDCEVLRLGQRSKASWRLSFPRGLDLILGLGSG